MDLTHNDVQNILKIIDEAEHLEEIELAYGDFRLHVRRHGAPAGGGAMHEAPAPAASAVPPATASAPPGVAAAPRAHAEPAVPEGMVAIRAPMLGTFYRAPSPGEKPFVELGQRVKASDTICLIEVMKLFNSITAGVDGRIAQILAENAALVEYRQILILIESDKT
ncbi:MAG: acetyl-CoA carboxylase biotin carboxyl carrier protein [Betaproteobacteria bacterium]|nr:acetyl-CoA carboxylase biotin carboxyl carrier protein [Betaproteobacteria bacterium]